MPVRPFEVLAVIIAVVTIGSLKSAILARHPAYTAASLHKAEVARTVPLVIGGLIAIGLWLWMAWANGKGRSWARVVAAVFFGINTLDLLISLLMVHAVATLIIGVVIWLVGLGAVRSCSANSPARSTSSSRRPPTSDRAGRALDPPSRNLRGGVGELRRLRDLNPGRACNPTALADRCAVCRACARRPSIAGTCR